MSKTIRERIQEIQSEVASNPDMAPGRAAELLNQTAAYLGNVSTEIVEADHAYNVVLRDMLDAHEKANRAKISAQATEEYKRLQMAKATLKGAEALERSLKYFLRVREAEYRASGSL